MQESAKAHIFKRFKSKKMNNEPQLKTRLEWLMEYPKPQSIQAVLNTLKNEKNCIGDVFAEHIEQSDALRAFSWKHSPEGEEYWEGFFASQHQKPTQKHRYPWHEAPDWAVFANTDSEGIGYWIGTVAMDDFHMPNIFEIEGHQFDTTDWRESLEIRPVEFQKQHTKI